MRASVADEVVGRGPSALWLEEGDFFESQSLLCKGTGKGEDVASVGNREQSADGKGWGWGHLIAGWATALSPFFALRSALRTSLFLRTMICDGVPANVEFFLKTLLGLLLLLLCAAAAAATARSAQRRHESHTFTATESRRDVHHGRSWYHQSSAELVQYFGKSTH